MRSDPSGALPPLWLIIACLLAVYIIWGTTYFGIKVAIEELPPFELLSTRFLAAGSVLLVWQRLAGQRWPARPQWPGAAALAFLLLVMGNGSASVAEHWVSSGATVALVSVMPLATALWSGVLGQWPRRLEWAAIALGGAGALIMILGRDLQASVAGTLILLAGTTSWSFGTVVSRRLNVPHGAMGFGIEMVLAGLMGVLISTVLGEHWVVPHTPRVWWAWGYLVVFGSLIAFSAYRYLVAHVSPTLAATYAYVNPPVGLLVGWWLGNESFSPHLLLGLPIVLAAVALQGWIHTRSNRGAPAARAA